MRRICGWLALALLIIVAANATNVDGIRLYWHAEGKANIKKIVIFVHGWTGDSTIWRNQVPALVAAKYRVIVLDLPGHGHSKSPADGKFSMDLFARSIEAIRRESWAKHVVLVGHSMGTPVVRQYARLYPEHTVALVLVDGLVRKPDDASLYAALTNQFSGPDGFANHEQFIKQMFVKTPVNLQPEILKVSMATPEATVVGAMAALADPYIWKEDVIDKPVLGIYAENSRLADREVTSKVFPQLQYTEIPGTDHFLMLEKPDEFNRLLLHFLSNITW